jgi:hypothetical protein
VSDSPRFARGGRRTLRSDVAAAPRAGFRTRAPTPRSARAILRTCFLPIRDQRFATDAGRGQPHTSKQGDGGGSTVKDHDARKRHEQDKGAAVDDEAGVARVGTHIISRSHRGWHGCPRWGCDGSSTEEREFRLPGEFRECVGVVPLLKKPPNVHTKES